MDDFEILTNLLANKDLRTIGLTLSVMLASYIIPKVAVFFIERSKAKQSADLGASKEIVNHYLAGDEAKTQWVNGYITDLKASVDSLESEIKQLRTEAKEAEARHDLESKAFNTEIQSLKTWRVKDAATIKEQQSSIETYRAENTQLVADIKHLVAEMKSLKVWKRKIEIVLGPWAERLIKGLSPSDVEEFEEILSGFADAVGGNDDD